MALESVSNVKHVPSQFDVKNGDVCLNSGQLERHSEEEGEDLEDGEILDDEEQETPRASEATPTSVPQPQTQIESAPVARTSQESATGPQAHTSKRNPTESRKSQRSKGKDDKESHSKRRKHHKKRHHEVDNEAPREKRSKRDGKSSNSEHPEAHEEGEEDDDEMLFVRGASPTFRQASPHNYSDYEGDSDSMKDDSGHYQGKKGSKRKGKRGASPVHNRSFSPTWGECDSDRESDAEDHEPHYRGGRGGKRRGRGGTSRGISDRGKGRKERGRSGRGGIKKVTTRKRENCLFYMNGKCHKGDDCTFLHSGSPQRKLEVCKFYVMNCCMKGDKCTYMHSDFPCKFFHTGMDCNREECLFSHEPLTDSTRAILKKHIETAPKDILGSFPNKPRENIVEMLHVDQDDNNKSSQDKKIPSLFDIKIKPPVSLPVRTGNSDSDEGNEEKERPSGKPPAGRRGIGFYAESRDDESDDPDDFDTQLRKCMEAQRLERELKAQQARQVEESTEAGLSIHIENPSERSETMSRENIKVEMSYPESSSSHPGFAQGPSSYSTTPPRPTSYSSTPPRPNSYSMTPPRPSFSESKPKYSMTPPRPNFYQDMSSSQQQEQPRGHLMHTEDEDSDDEGQLVMATQDDEEQPSQHTASDTGGEEDTEDGVPKQLPKKQRELFLRIQQQQAQRAAAKAAEEAEAAKARQELEARSMLSAAEKADTGSPTRDPAEVTPQHNRDDESDSEEKDQNWYSSDDDDAGEKNLADILKNISQQTTPPQGYPSPTLPTSDVAKPSTTSALDNVNLSQINISADITKLLSSIRSKAEEATTSTASSQLGGARDPRMSRDPRARNPSGLNLNEMDTKPPAGRPVQSQSTGDIDLRMLPGSSKDMDLRTRPSNSLTDTDLRQSCFGDTDLRNVSLLGLPFKPAPLHVPCKEIDASIASHPPLEYKVVPAHVSAPNYSYLKLNLSDPHVRGDPRLKKLVSQLEAMSVSPMSPPPQSEAPNVDPRVRADPRTIDPRLARLAATNPPVIPVNPLPPPIPIEPPMMAQFPPMMNPLGGILENSGRPGEGLLGPVPVPVHMMGIMGDPQRPALLATPPLPSQQVLVEDFDLRPTFPSFRGHRGGGGWERRGGRRGRGNWDSNRRNRRDFGNRSPPGRDYSPPPRHNRSPPRRSRSPNRDKRRRSSPNRDPSPGKRHSRHSPKHHSSHRGGDSGSFTPPRSSFTPPRDNSG